MKKITLLFFVLFPCLLFSQAYVSGKDLVSRYVPHDHDFFTKRMSGNNITYLFSVEDQINGTDLGGLFREAGLIDRFLAYDGKTKKVTVRHIPAEAQARVDEADNLFFEKKLTEALIKYNKLIADYPDYAMFQTLAGEVYYAKGDFKNALKKYEKAIAINPFGYLAYWFAAECSMKLNDKKKALDYISYAYALNKDYSGMNILLEEILSANSLYKRNNAFLPFAVQRETDNSCRIRFFGNEGINFLPMASVMAVWQMDPLFIGYRKMMLDDKVAPTPLFFEMIYNQKLAIEKKLKNKTPLSVLETRFKTIADDEKALKFLLGWEMLFKGYPEFTYGLDIKELKELTNYIKKYVFVKINS